MARSDAINPPPRKSGTQRPRNGGSGKFVKSAVSAERAAEAAKLRTTGLSWDDIAKALGFADGSGAYRAAQQAMRAIAEPAQELRAIELARLDFALRMAWQAMTAEHITVQQGRVVTDPVTGLPLRDWGPVLAAIDRVVKLGERRAKLLGLDAPTKIEAITVDQIEAAINQLADELGMNDRPAIEA